MGLFEIITVGVGLAMDACVLTISNCTVYQNKLTKKQEWSMPIAFAIFQGIMPLIGFLIGSVFASYIASVSGYLTSAVFFVLFGKILYDIIKDAINKDNEDATTKTEFSFGVLIAQAVATSIDALLIGMVMSLGLKISIVWAIAVIVLITFILVLLALLFGKMFGKFFGKFAPYFGAGIMLLLATKTLIEAIIG